VSDHVVFRKSWPIGFVAMLQALATPIMAVVSLRFCAWLYEIEFDQYFVMLSALVATLCLVLFDNQRSVAGASVVGPPRLPLTTGILVRWMFLLAALLMIGFATKLSSQFSRLVLFTWCVVTPVPLVLLHLLLRELRRKVVMDPSNARRVIFAGVNEVSLQLAERMQRSAELCMSVDGFFDDRSEERLGGSPGSVRMLGRLHELGGYVKSHRIDVIFVALPIRHVSRVMQLLDDLRDTTASIYYVPDIFVFDLIQARAGEIQGIPVVALCETPFAGYKGAIKRTMDVTVALGAVLVLLPLLLAIGIAVKLSSPGPAIFRQRRYGLDGKEIIVYKFRTMTVTEDGTKVVQATRGDDRVTRVGRVLRRYSLDELPQLLNVVQGRMSLIGPRPHAVAHNEEYRKLIKGYMIRHKVLPGITGLAQVSGCRGETSSLEDMQARIRFDLEYLRRWSIGLDLQILLKTALLVFNDKKAY
jgi:putative colanic acid biosynthesis UDP-glucose lipid carrier transferase